jgi:hypothetical protein
MEVSGQLHSLTPLLRGKCPQYPLDKRLGGAQNRSGRFGEEKSLLTTELFWPYCDLSYDTM